MWQPEERAPPNQTVNPTAITGGTMGIETLNAINEGMYLSTLMMIEVIVLMVAILAIAGFAIYLAGIAWFCFEETRRSITAPRTARRASPPNAWESPPRAPNMQARMIFTREEPLLREQQLQRGA